MGALKKKKKSCAQEPYRKWSKRQDAKIKQQQNSDKTATQNLEKWKRSCTLFHL